MGRHLKFQCDFCHVPLKTEISEIEHGTLQWRKPNPLLKTAGFYEQWKICLRCWVNIRKLLVTELGKPKRDGEDD